MNRRIAFSMLAVAAIGLLTLATVRAVTTFSWSGPQASGTLTYTGLGLTGTTLNGDVTYAPTSQTSVTNNQAVTLASRFVIVTGTGGADNTTNRITLANPGTQGILRTIMVSRSSSNLIDLVESAANLDLSSATNEMDNLDSLTLYAESTTNWVEVGKTDNSP